MDLEEALDFKHEQKWNIGKTSDGKSINLCTTCNEEWIGIHVCKKHPLNDVVISDYDLAVVEAKKALRKEFEERFKKLEKEKIK